MLEFIGILAIVFVAMAAAITIVVTALVTKDHGDDLRQIKNRVTALENKIFADDDAA